MINLLSLFKKRKIKLRRGCQTDMHFSLHRETDEGYKSIIDVFVSNDKKVVITKTFGTEYYEITKDPHVNVINTEGQVITCSQRTGLLMSELQMIVDVINENN